ncbi:tellurite resistance TerB family protein [Bradyrhizobium sp. PMVTL-01]|uniref:tellurite resistance TerB family protein n=1 Tax=Bradyrhizobium sp. PMVTL-01 TaxID=3434999 RepID=UPI003F6FBA0D
MSFFGAVKKAFTSGAREINKEYGQNRNFLNAVCASAALVANADGSIEDTEKLKAIQLITNNATLSSLYQRNDIEAALESAFKSAKDASGRQTLARSLDSILTMPNGTQMAEDVYLVATDIANADGSVSDEEKAIMEKIARRLNVDPKKFDF